MRTSAISLHIARLLILVGGLASACLAVAILSSNAALAHAGHRHAAAVQPVGQTAQVAQVAAPDHPAAIERHMLPAADMAGRVQGADAKSSSNGKQYAGASATDLTMSRMAAHCVCCVGCGSCTSLSCCAAALMPHWHNQVVRQDMAVHTSTTAVCMVGASTAPPARPPNSSQLA